jgi:UDP-N-acetylglucosamine--N-acetylmuramyl-(pentapeptide) pyrophosphoryl-undecaprenol N-acetylglucosamine transferase
MKILLTGGGSGGHFYPIIAVAQSIRNLAKAHKFIDVELYYMAPEPYDKNALFENDIKFIQNSSGKVRRYFSLLNFFDLFKTAWGTLRAIWKIYWIYPDVIFGKGGYVSFPAMVAARFFRIPVVIHESDSHPGRVNAWAGRFAEKIAVSYPQAAEFFKKEKVAYTGNPIRHELIRPVREGAHEYLHLEPSVPVILVLGGSQGAQAINDSILDALPRLVEKYQIIHQAGSANLKSCVDTSKVILGNNPHKDRYKAFDYLNSLALRMAAGVADIVVSRAGSTIFEIAAWGTPAIIIPIPQEISHDQTKNAYSYSHTGAAVVIEQHNLTANILVSEINRIISDAALRGKMRTAALAFSRSDSADLIAQEILEIAVKHEI